MTFYLVGPSGAGKSTLGRLLASAGAIRFVDSDDVLVGETGALQWEAVLSHLNEWEADGEDQPLLVAIGAGTQDIDRVSPNHPLRNWLADRSERVIAVSCTPEETLGRRSAYHVSLASVQSVEFNDARLQIYGLAQGLVITSGRVP